MFYYYIQYIYIYWLMHINAFTVTDIAIWLVCRGVLTDMEL